MYDLVFNEEPERRQLDKLFTMVDFELQNNKLGRAGSICMVIGPNTCARMCQKCATDSDTEFGCRD